MADHVHMMISIPPKYAVSQVIGFIKGGLVQNWGYQWLPDIFAPVLGPGVGRGVDFEVGGSRRRGSLRGHHEDQQA
jgi:hypothetical protein